MMKPGHKFHKDSTALEIFSIGASVLILILAVLFLTGLLQRPMMLYCILSLGVFLHFLLGTANLLRGKKLLAGCMFCVCVIYIGI
ncbi:MAG TPA: hypothetical protein IAB84_09195, partial [Candidatus Choladousia intestinigallinarum]|nr:hypothetical protein [Candidatus Choladousia intestinigallinarum]